MKNLIENCAFPYALSLDAVKYFITGELNHKEANITNLYQMRYAADSREAAENTMLQAEQKLFDMEHFWKDLTQVEFDEFIADFDAELQALL
jgi:hypothetical protein